MFKNPFSFSGRIRRTEYGLSYIMYMFSAVLVGILLEDESLAFLVLLAYIPLLWFLFAQGAKRCHDRGHSGFYQLIPFYVLWMFFAEGSNRGNAYGPDPKGLPDLDSFAEDKYTL